MASSAPARPRQVTLAASFIMVGSVIAVVFSFQRIAGLSTIEVRESFTETLSQPPMSGLGISVESLIEVTRVLSMVVGGAATATAILGFYVLQRSRSARIALSFLAPVLFLAGLVVADLVTALVAAGVVMLWVRPISDWYAGRPITEPGRRPRQGASASGGRGSATGTPPAPSPTPCADPPPADPGPSDSATSSSSSAFPSSLSAPASDGDARPTQGFGSAPTTADRPEQPEQPAQTERTGAVAWSPRPRPVLVACVLTWVFAGVTVVGVGLSLVALLAAPDLVLDELRRQQPSLTEEDLTEGVLRTATIAVAAVVGPWCAFAALAAVQAFRRRPWARTGLVVSAGLAAAASLLALLLAGAGAVALLTLVGSGLTVSLLLRPDSRAWFAGAAATRQRG